MRRKDTWGGSIAFVVQLKRRDAALSDTILAVNVARYYEGGSVLRADIRHTRQGVKHELGRRDQSFIGVQKLVSIAAVIALISWSFLVS